MRLLYIVFLFLIASCATISEMNVEKGTFQTIKPPNIYGNDRYLTNETNSIISYDANIGKNKTIPLPGITNERTSCDEHDLLYLELYNEFCVQKIPANINYRLIENTLGIQFHKATKYYGDHYFGWGVGVQNQPYGFLMLGYNGKFFEVGGTGFWGLTINKASYEGMWYFYHGGTFAESEVENLEYIKFKDVTIFHSYVGAVAHASFYWKKFALSYAASITNPWLVNELPAGFPFRDDLKDAFISFWFPALLMQDIGISYTPHKIKYRLGINQITGVKFPGQSWGLSVQMAYLFNT